MHGIIVAIIIATKAAFSWWSLNFVVQP